MEQQTGLLGWEDKVAFSDSRDPGRPQQATHVPAKHIKAWAEGAHTLLDGPYPPSLKTFYYFVCVEVLSKCMSAYPFHSWSYRERWVPMELGLPLYSPFSLAHKDRKL